MHETLRIQIVDSHTAGEPTRVVIAGGPDLGTGPLSDLRARFARDFDPWRSAIVNEPRGSDVMVGALLVPPHATDCDAGVIFFNNVGYLGMCGHGTLGVVETLRHLGRIQGNTVRLDTPVGTVQVSLRPDGRIMLVNVPAYRYRKDVAVEVPGMGRLHGDIAWGGNWFFLVGDHGLDLDAANVEILGEASRAIRRALEAQGLTGEGGALIDHVELTGPPKDPANHGRNFVCCPGSAYDRSPCGTGTSAKLACLFEDGKLQEDQVWRQESVIGSVFEGWINRRQGCMVPHIAGRAFITAEATLLLDPEDPFRWGIRP